MSTAIKVVRNTVIQSIGRALMIGMSLISTALVTRYLGPSDYGIYSFVFVYISFFHIIADLGISAIITREISQDKNASSFLLSNTISLRIILSFFSIIVACLIIQVMNYPLTTKFLIYITSIMLIIEALKTTVDIIFEVNLRLEYVVISNVLISLSFLILAALFVYKRGTLVHLVAISLISNLGGLLVAYLFSKKFVKIKLSLNYAFWKKIIKESIPLGIAFFMISIYWRIDVIMLSLMKGDQAVGLYNISFKFIEIGTILSGMIMASIFPILSDRFKSDPIWLKSIYQRSLKYMLIIGISLALFFVILADKIILYISGEEFRSSILSMQFLGLIYPVYYPGALIGYMFITIGKQWVNTIFNTLAVLFNIGLNLLLIPKYSFYGSSFATVLTEIVQVVAALVVLSLVFKYSPSFKSMVRPLFAGALSLLVLLLPTQVDSFIKVLVAFGIFIGSLFLMKELSKEDVYLLLNKSIAKA
ncbi:MAG: flippase [bacterium]|nr:flippase [bacterium]